MRKTTGIIISLLVVAIFAVAGNAYFQKKAWSDGVAKLDDWSFVAGNEYNGGIDDIVIGNKDAKVKIIEYADFQCSACALSFPYIHEVVKEYGDKIAYIYRNYAIQYHTNATAAATAAYAANNQGYFEEFAEILFDKQNDWFYSEGETRDKQFESYFLKASEEKGDLEKYKNDLNHLQLKISSQWIANLQSAKISLVLHLSSLIKKNSISLQQKNQSLRKTLRHVSTLRLKMQNSGEKAHA